MACPEFGVGLRFTIRGRLRDADNGGISSGPLERRSAAPREQQAVCQRTPHLPSHTAAASLAAKESWRALERGGASRRIDTSSYWTVEPAMLRSCRICGRMAARPSVVLRHVRRTLLTFLPSVAQVSVRVHAANEGAGCNHQRHTGSSPPALPPTREWPRNPTSQKLGLWRLKPTGSV